MEEKQAAMQKLRYLELWSWHL